MFESVRVGDQHGVTVSTIGEFAETIERKSYARGYM